MGLDGVELVMECEEHFRIKITDDQAGAVHTVGDLQDLCVRLIREQTSNPLSKESDVAVVHDILRILISEQLGVKPERVVRDANFVDDLGLI